MVNPRLISSTHKLNLNRSLTKNLRDWFILDIWKQLYVPGTDTDGNLLMIPTPFYTPSPEEQIIQQRSRRIVARAVALQYENLDCKFAFLINLEIAS